MFYRPGGPRFLTKEVIMKNRSRQRKNRLERPIVKEEKIASKNNYGIYDPTPYEAVRNIIQSQKKAG